MPDGQQDPLGILSKPAPAQAAGGDDPLGILKKKDATVSPYPIFATPTPTPEKPSGSSVSSSALQQDIFGLKGKDEKTPVDQNLFADEKGSLIDKATQKALSKAKDENEKQSINIRKHELTDKFFNGKLDGNDVKYISDMVTPDQKNNQGLTDDQVADAINNKTKNLRNWTNHSLVKGVASSTAQLAEINNQLTTLKSASAKLGINKYDDKIKELETQRDYLHHSISQVANTEIQNVLPKVASDLKNIVAPGKDWDTVLKENTHTPTAEEQVGLDRPNADKQPYFIEYNPKTSTLTKESTASVLKFASDWANKNKNEILQAGQFGHKVAGDNNDYSDLGNSLVSYFNNTIPVEHATKAYADEWTKENKAFAPLINSKEKIRNYFNPEHIKAAESVVKPWQDKQFVLTQEKYSGKNGIITTNPELIKVQHKYADAVGSGEMTEEVARKNIKAEIENNPVLKKLNAQYDDEVRNIQKKGQDMYADFLTKGIRADVDPNLTITPDGSVTVKGKSVAETRNALEQYNNGLAVNTANVIHSQNKALGLDANQRAERQGSFIGSFKAAHDSMMGAAYNAFFHMTGWDGDHARMYQAEKIANEPVTQSDVAKAWNWEGLKSLINPKFYAAQVGGMIPVMAPAAAVTAVTEGAGAPEAINWIASAGVFTAQGALQFREGLQNATNKYGDKLSDEEADNAAAKEASQTYLPNLVAMMLNLGTLSRTNAIVKPTVGKAVKEAVLGAALGTVPMAAQGYLDYANQQTAEGKKADIWDHMQDGGFATSMIDAFTGGLLLQVPHTLINHAAKVNNWKYMIATGVGEFHDNAMYNVALQHAIDGNGELSTDAIKMHVLNEAFKTPQEKANLETLLQYSTALNRNAKEGSIDLTSINGAYQAHNLALADLHEQWAEGVKDKSKNLSKIYADQAKDFREEARNVMEGKGKFNYLMDANDQPVFLSDNSFKHLDKEGIIADWLDKGTIQSVHNSAEPNFDSEYKNSLVEKEDIEARPPMQPKFEEGQAETIVQALRDHRDGFSKGGEAMYGIHLDNPDVKPEELAGEIISQAADHQGNMRNAIGKEAFKKIKPILDEQIELSKKKPEPNQEPVKTEGNEDKIISGDKLEGKPIFSDYNSTIEDKENNLLPFGEEIKQRVENGEPVTIVTRSGSEGDKENEQRMLDAFGFKEKPENLTIMQGMSPEEKAEVAGKEGGVLIDNSKAVLDAAEKEKGVTPVDANELNANPVVRYSRGVPEPREPEKPGSKGIMKRANNIEDLNSPRDRALQYFTGGGKIHADVIKELFRGSEGEKRSRIGLLSKTGTTIDRLAHDLWESGQDHEGNNPFTTEDYRDAIEQVLQEHVSQVQWQENW